MSKIPKAMWLASRLLSAIIGGLLISCNQGGERQAAPPINPDTVRHHVISIAEADAMTASFRAAIDTMEKSRAHFRDSLDFGHAEAFPADVFRELLQQSDSSGPAVGIRIYYGRDPDGKVRQILVPFDSAGRDIINHIIDIEAKPNRLRTAASNVSNGQAVENGQRCPPVCDTTGGLNQP
ncbi:MAG TPA: hypothetical protein VGR89_03860 [Puia sp.]|nr:hypothetical protein [Puia sp.]